MPSMTLLLKLLKSVITPLNIFIAFTLYSFTCKYSNFTGGNYLFKQNIGVQMGSYYSGQIANLVLAYIEFFFFTNWWFLHHS